VKSSVALSLMKIRQPVAYHEIESHGVYAALSTTCLAHRIHESRILWFFESRDFGSIGKDLSPY